MLPRFDIQALDEDGFVDLYVVNGWLPGDVPLEWMRSCEWGNQFACYDGDLVKQRGESLNNIRAEFCEKTICEVERLRTEVLCPVAEAMLVHCTRCEVSYLEAFRSIPLKRLDAWRGAPLIDPAAWVWDLAELRVEFRFLRKNGPYWNVLCTNERHLRSKKGRAIPYKDFATFGFG